VLLQGYPVPVDQRLQTEDVLLTICSGDVAQEQAINLLSLWLIGIALLEEGIISVVSANIIEIDVVFFREELPPLDYL